jgi:glycosyltransferase involved in cell wall biosynthesis
VIALDAGGVRESVEPGVTGVFYEDNNAEALAEAVLGFDALAIDPEACRAAAERFSVRHFQDRLAAIVAEATSDERAPRPGERSRLQAGLLHGARRPRVVR